MRGRRAYRLKRLLRDERISVGRIEVAAHDKREDTVYVFYNRVEEGEKKEKETLERLKPKAEEVATDEVYAKLTNSKQRELFLLDHYNLSKKESGDVIELVKMLELEKAIRKSEKEEIKGGDEKI